ncbi:hypothetical protein PR002_g1968 [Phytophthora rubi]|uniref:Reverse transcriptase Ty1/copia-type domain-containing protein n=1 Tax=Phytophthora rubi TaxID=129364 RepID=A0A6A3NK54_9STRA|nr:hypothetical protein PR002_g1968 [Phytophthora rubi]
MLKDENEVKLLLTVCVDNLLLIGPRDICAKVAASLQETFELTNMGNVKHLLGVEILINRPRRETVYCQRQYVLEVLKRFHMENFATGVQLPKRLACYDHTHYAQAKRVLRYLKATSDFGLLMNVASGDEGRVAAYSDEDYANDPVDRRSVSGYVTTLDGNVVSYASRKQEINALSTC